MSLVYYLLPAVALLLFRKFREYKWGYCKNDTSLKGKVVVITGANSGIGYETAKELTIRGAKVIFACRDMQKAAKAICDIEASLGHSTDMARMKLDLGSIKSIYSFVEEFNKYENKIDILINNAAVLYPISIKEKTEDGFEIHFGVNHLGHVLLTKLLLPNLKAAAPSRVIIVSSMLHKKGNIYLDDLNLENREGKSSPYNNSKLANVYYARELAKTVKNDGINVYAVCPGWVYTGLFRNHNIKWFHYILIAPIAYWFMRTPKQGAQTVIYCATEPSLANETGNYYKDCGQYNKSIVNLEPNISKKLWDASEQMIEDAKKKLL